MKERVRCKKEKPVEEQETRSPFLDRPRQVESMDPSGEHVPVMGKSYGRACLQLVSGSSGRSSAIVQRQEEEGKPNKTGLPDRLKEGIERMSGYDLSEVRVNYNSPKPAQVNALAYTQGTAIEVAPGQEKHLPHETWHVVQQMQGRVKPTVQMKGKIKINDDRWLENEADRMGRRTLQEKDDNTSQLSLKSNKLVHNSWTPIQRVLIIGEMNVEAAQITEKGEYQTQLNPIISEEARKAGYPIDMVGNYMLEMVGDDAEFTYTSIEEAVQEAIAIMTKRITTGVQNALNPAIGQLNKEVILENLRAEFKDYPGGLVAVTRAAKFAEELLEGIRRKQSPTWEEATRIREVPHVEWQNDELKHWNVRHYTNKVRVKLGQHLGQGYFLVDGIEPPPFKEILSTATLSAQSGQGGQQPIRPTYKPGQKVMLSNSTSASKSGHTTSTDWVNIGNVGDTFYGLFYNDDPATGITPSFIRDATYCAIWGVEDFGVGWASSDWLGTAQQSQMKGGKTPEGEARSGELSDIIADIYPMATSRKSEDGEESKGEKKARQSAFAAMTNFEVKKHGPMKVTQWIPKQENLDKLKNYTVNMNKQVFVKFKALLPKEVQAQL
ncbi:MAG: DUF4157 domain-containing protein [Spirulina sp.]